MIIVELTVFLMLASAATGNGQLTKIGDYCTCPNRIATYKCVVNGTGFTLWQGTAFECPASENIIRLRHSEFSNGTMGLCNNREIVGYSIRVGPGGTYTSQLNVSVNSNVINKTIECAHQSSALNITPIDSMTIAIPDPPSPPLNVHLDNATPRELEFSWSSLESSCSTLRYTVLASNCGMCPTDLLKNPHTSCLIQKPDVVGSYCRFSVRSVVCGNIIGAHSNVLNVTLKVPQMPEIGSVLPTYDNNTNRLILLTITFFKVESFNISSGIDSNLIYTANYSDLATGVVCDSHTISESVTRPDVCANNVCRIEFESFDNHSCSQSGYINVSISASNRLGNGPASYKIIETTNQFVRLVHEQNGTIVCTFLNHTSLRVKCEIAYGSCEQPLTSVVRGITTSPNTVVISLPKPLAINDCYTITATNDTFSLQIQGMSSTNSNRNSQDVGLIVGLVVGIVAAIIIGLLITVLLVYVFLKRKKLCTLIQPPDGGAINEGNPIDLGVMTDGNEVNEGNPIDLGVMTDGNEVNEEEGQRPQGYSVMQYNIKFTIKEGIEHFLTALKILRKNEINIKNIKLQENVIYIEVDSMTLVLKTKIEKLPLGIVKTTVYVKMQEAIIQKTEDQEIGPERHVVTEVLAHTPGALYAMIECLYSTNVCHYIRCIDVDHQSVPRKAECKSVTVSFVPILPENWRIKYNNNKKKKKYRHMILHID